MAKGLRKLIKKARSYTTSSTLTRRNRYGPRLRVEELEERIAPADAVLAATGEFVTWDVDNPTDGGFDTDDGVLILGANSTAGITVADMADDMVPNITVTAATTNATEKILIASNKAIGNIDLSNVSNTTTTLQLVVASGFDIPPADGGGDFATFNVDGVALGAAAAQDGESTGFTLAAAEDHAADATGGIGTITLPATHTGLNVEVHIITGTTGTITATW